MNLNSAIAVLEATSEAYEKDPDERGLQFHIEVDPYAHVVTLGIAGTDDLKDVISDVRAFPKKPRNKTIPGRWHSGAMSLGDHQWSTYAEVRDLFTGYRHVRIGGHSLGGMVARFITAIVLFETRPRPFRKLELYDFGTPACCTKRACDALTSHLGQFNYARFIKGADRIARARIVRMLGYRQPKGLRYLPDHTKKPEIRTERELGDYLKEAVTFDYVSDHSCQGYLDRLLSIRSLW